MSWEVAATAHSPLYEPSLIRRVTKGLEVYLIGRSVPSRSLPRLVAGQDQAHATSLRRGFQVRANQCLARKEIIVERRDAYTQARIREMELPDFLPVVGRCACWFADQHGIRDLLKSTALVIPAEKVARPIRT